jgi:hypothetical protein
MAGGAMEGASWLCVAAGVAGAIVASSVTGLAVAGGLDPGFFLGRNRVPPFSDTESEALHWGK